MNELSFLEVNAAQITKEGISGNSLSKILSPLVNYSHTPIVVFVDEFDKLFINGNTNSQLANESTASVQNEFLKLLERICILSWSVQTCCRIILTYSLM